MAKQIRWIDGKYAVFFNGRPTRVCANCNKRLNATAFREGKKNCQNCAWKFHIRD